MNTAISEIEEVSNGISSLVTEQDKVEQSIIKANDKKYRQTNDTPLMSDLLPDLGFLGDSPACKKILKGEYVPCQPTDNHTRAFLQELKMAPNIPPISTKYTAQDYINGWKKMNEFTTAGLSGIHFGHHKACSTNLFLSNFESIMCAVPYRTGYSPRRYKKSVNAMLLKKLNEKKQTNYEPFSSSRQTLIT